LQLHLEGSRNTHQDHQAGCRAEGSKANIWDFIKLRKMSQNILEGSAPCEMKE
jgi:hypothetical protein